MEKQELSLEDRARKSVVEKLRLWSEQNPDEVVLISGEKKITRKLMLKEVEENTLYGQNLINNWLELALEHIINSKVTSD